MSAPRVPVGADQAAHVGGGTAARIAALLQLTAARTLRPVPLALAALLAALPLLFALMFRSTGGDESALASFLLARYEGLVVTLLLPLTALLTAAGAVSAEREDGTVLYLLTTTTSRTLLAVVRWVFATVVTSCVVTVSVVGTGLIAGGGREPTGVMLAFVVGSMVGASVYSALFLAMAVWLRRALLMGLLYVLLWEGVVSNILPVVRYLSARQVLLGVTHGLVHEAERGAETFASAPPGGVSLAWAVGVTLAALGVTIVRLRRLPLARAH